MKNQPEYYKTPDSDLNIEETFLEVIPASKGIRLINLIIDYFAYVILSSLFLAFVSAVFGTPAITYIESIPEIIFGSAVILIYYVVFEGLTGRTIGKFITRTKVVNDKGEKATFAQILTRSCIRLITLEALTFLGPKGRGWHDSLPNTYVVDCT